MLPESGVSCGSWGIQNRLRIQAVSTVKKNELSLFFSKIVGQRTVCDQITGKCQGFSIFFSAGADQCDILR